MSPAETTGFNLQVSDGLTLNGCVWRNDTAKAVILFMHGIESHLGWFQDTGAALCEAGYTVYAIDRRGSGHSEGTPGHMGSFRDVVGDIRTFVDYVRESENSNLDLIGLGLSLGSNFWSSYSILHPDSIDGIVMVGPGIKPRVGVSLGRRLWILGHAFLSPKTLFPIPIRDDMFTANPAFKTFLASDSLRRKTVTARFFLELLKMQRFLSTQAGRLQLPLHVILAGDDTIIDNDGVVRWVQKTGSERASILEYEGAYHSLQFELPGGELASAIVAGIQDWKRKESTKAPDVSVVKTRTEYVRG